LFKEILKIFPQVDSASLGKMERTLNGRFARVAKKFGKGIIGSLIGGGLLGAAVGVIDKLLNPLKEVQEAIDRTLQSADDIVSNAEQFGTDSGTLAKIQGFGKASGLDAEGVNTLISKFQVALAENQADPTKNTSVSAFRGEKDSAKAFFEFIQSLQELGKRDKAAALLVQQEVFGEKQILKAAEFLNADFLALSKSLSGVSAEQLAGANNKLAGIKDVEDVRSVIRDQEDRLAKGRLINDGVSKQRDDIARIDQQRENERIKNFENLANVQATTGKILHFLETEGFKLLEQGINKITEIAGTINKLTQSSLFKTFFGKSKD
jgi:hypothetical protein